MCKDNTVLNSNGKSAYALDYYEEEKSEDKRVESIEEIPKLKLTMLLMKKITKGDDYNIGI